MAALFRLVPELKDLRLDVKATRNSPLSCRIVFKQRYENLPVFEGGITVHLRGTDKIIFLVYNHYLPDLDLSVTPTLTENDCIEIAYKYFIRNYHFPHGVTAKHMISNATEPQLKLGILEHDSRPHLIYKIILFFNSPLEIEEYMVDANTGNVLTSRSRIIKN